MLPTTLHACPFATRTSRSLSLVALMLPTSPAFLTNASDTTVVPAPVSHSILPTAVTASFGDAGSTTVVNEMFAAGQVPTASTPL